MITRNGCDAANVDPEARLTAGANRHAATDFRGPKNGGGGWYVAKSKRGAMKA